MYEHLSGTAASQALLDAAKRAQELELAAPEELDDDELAASVQDAPAPSTDLQSKSHGDAFLNAYCDLHNQSSADKKALWTSVTGTGSFTWTTLDVVQSAARSRSGTIRFRVRWRPRASWSGYTTLNLSAGQAAVYYEAYRPVLRFAWNSIVDQADGDHYDFCSWGFN